MRVLSAADVETLADPDLVIAAQEAAFIAASDGTAQVPPRAEIHRTDPSGVALIMPGLIGNTVLGVKLIGSVETQARQYTTCLTLVWDAANLAPRGLIAADLLNDYRTAAGFAVGTRLLARGDSATHVLFGTGKLSFPSATYIARVRKISRLILVSRTPAKVTALAQRLAADPAMSGVEIVTGLSADEAAAEADIITTVTRSATPLFDGKRLKPGTHVNLGGAMRPQEREMDDEAARRGFFWLDADATCRQRAGDVIQPLKSGALTEDRIMGEIGDALRGKVPGRKDTAQVTVFRSMGIAAQDLVLAGALLDQAESQNIGQVVKL